MTDVLRSIGTVQRLEREGGVILGRLEVEQRRTLIVEAEIGLVHMKKAVYVFRCPVCGNTARNDQEMEPMCTGPSWTDDHPPSIMNRIGGGAL